MKQYFIMQFYLRLILLISVISISIPTWADSVTFTFEGIQYKLEDGKVSVYRSPKGEFSGEVIIPRSVDLDGNTYTVSGIYSEAFHGSVGLTSVILPETITKIGYNAFTGCTALKVLQLGSKNPPYVDVTEDGGFPDIKSTCKLIVPTESIELYLDATGWNEFVNIVPLMPKYDGTNCYNGVINSYRIFGQFYSPIINKQFPLYLSNSNRNINVGIGGSVPFDNVECRAILGLDIISDTPIRSYPRATPSAEFMDITLPPLSWDGIYALLFFRNNEVVGVCYMTDRGKLVDDLLYYTYNTFNNEATIIKYGGTYSSRPTALTIPEIVQLSNDNVQKSFKVSKIFDEALINYNTLESIVIPKTITYVGPNAFKGCTSLSDITLVDGDKTLDFSSSLSPSGVLLPALNDCPIQKVYMGRNLYSSAFKGQTKLRSVVIGDSVTYLSSSIFYNCYSLNDLKMGKSIKSILEDAFYGCSALEKIDLPTGLSEIGQRAFANCESLKGLILPETITELGTNSNGPVNPNNIFSGCDSLKDVICLYPPSIGKPVVHANAVIYNPNATQYGWGLSMLTMPFPKWGYSGDNPSIQFYINYEGEILNLYNITYKYSMPAIYNSNGTLVNNYIDVGTYSGYSKITMTYNGGSFQYELPFELEIVKAPLIISAPDITREYGKRNPSFELEYNGFVNDETESVLSKYPTITLSALNDSDVGVYPIELSGAEARNYDISYVSGSLTITKADQNIIWSQIFNNIKVGDQVALNAYATSDLPIQYEISDPNIATLSGDILSFHAPGDLVLTAKQEGNENYNASEPEERIMYILPQSIEALYLNSNEIKIKEGESSQLTVSWVPDDIELPVLVWSSSNPEYATVDNTGLVNGIQKGKSTVTVSLKDNPDIFASCVVVVDIISGIKEPVSAMDANYTIDNRKLIITTDLASPIAIYSIDGKVINSGFVKEIFLQDGIYILHLNGKSFKLKI